MGLAYRQQRPGSSQSSLPRLRRSLGLKEASSRLLHELSVKGGISFREQFRTGLRNSGVLNKTVVRQPKRKKKKKRKRQTLSHEAAVFFRSNLTDFGGEGGCPIDRVLKSHHSEHCFVLDHVNYKISSYRLLLLRLQFFFLDHIFSRKYECVPPYLSRFTGAEEVIF
jgi:hypothetical protein